MKREILVKILILMTCLSLGGWGVQAAELPVYEEEEVVVTATRIKQEASKAPGKTEVITKEEIVASGAATVAEALAGEGVVISSYGGASGAATVQLDGAKSSQTLILINGVPANAGTGGSVDLSYFPTAGVQRIEVVHGPLSALYGTNALGGVVNIITDLTGITVNQMSLTGGSNNYGQLELSLIQSNYGLAVGGRKTDGYRNRSGANTKFIMGQFDFWQDEHSELRLNILYNDKDYQNPGKSNSTTIADGLQENLAVDLSGKSMSNQLAVEYKIYGQHLKMLYDSYYPAWDYLSKSHYQTNIFGTDLAALYRFTGHTFLGGIQLKQYNFNSTSVGEHITKNGALFVQDDWQINSLWQVVSGMRWDSSSDYSSPLCPRISLNYLASENLTLKAGYGRAFRGPTIDDLYWPETTDEYGTTTGNANLKPETSERYEFTGEWKKDKQIIGVNVFLANTDDEIRWVQTGTTFRPENVDKVQTQGTNVYWHNQWNSFLTADVKYTRTEKKNWDETTKSYSINDNEFGRDHYSIDLGFKVGKWVSNLSWKYVAHRPKYNWDDRTTTEMSDYDIINLAVKYQVTPQLSYGLTVNNLGDEQYEVNQGYPMPGREYYLSANYTF